MKASYRKAKGSFYGVIVSDDRLVWLCPHTHDKARKANACARRQLSDLPRGAGLRRLLRRVWRPKTGGLRTDEAGKPILSRSYIEGFLQCVQYQNDESPDAAFGTAVHAAIHAYWQLCVATHQESMLSEVDRIVKEAFWRQPGVDPERYDEAREMMWTFLERRTAGLRMLHVVDRQPCIEFTLRADLGWAWAEGRVDRIDRMDGDDPDDPPRIIRIRDYKTGWPLFKPMTEAPSNGSRRRIPHEFQRRAYAMFAFLDPRLNPALEVVETEIDYPRALREPEIIPYERGELDEWWRDIQWALAQKWQERDGPPTGCAACEYCAVRQTCGATLTEARGIPTDATSAKALVEDWIRTKTLQQTQRKRIRAYFLDRDSMVVNGLEIGFMPPRSATWRASDPLGIVNYMKANGYEGEAAMVTWVDPTKVPVELKAPMVDAGVARWDPGKADFELRKAGSDDDE